MNPPEWMRDAECTNYDPDWWSLEAPDGGQNAVWTRANQTAMNLCNACPVRVRCLAWKTAREADGWRWPLTIIAGVRHDARGRAVLERPPAPQEPVPVLTLGQAAKRARMSPSGIRAAIAAGRIPATQDLRGWWQIPTEALDAYVPYARQVQAAA